METLIASNVTRSTVLEASCSWQAMPLSAALGVRILGRQTCVAPAYRPVHGPSVPASRPDRAQRSDLLITDLSTIDHAATSDSYDFDGTKRIQGLNASMGANTTRLGSRPPSPPV
jgi:hypothetical protein